MFLLLLLLISFSFYFVFLTWCLRLHARVLRRPFCVDSGNSMCFSYWKNVRLKLKFPRFPGNVCDMFQLLLKECTIEANWPFLRCAEDLRVSVVIERMYDWSMESGGHQLDTKTFQLLLKECTIEAFSWSHVIHSLFRFQLLLKECTIEAPFIARSVGNTTGFSCYWKIVRLKLQSSESAAPWQLVSVVIERMYDWSQNVL